LTASVAGRQLSRDGIDHFTLRGDRAVEGIAYFDTLPLWTRLDPTMQRTSSSTPRHACVGSSPTRRSRGANPWRYPAPGLDTSISRSVSGGCKAMPSVS
jgi:hypothetical protein